VDELIDSEKVFAMQTLGSPNTMKTYDKLNQRCVPQPFIHHRPPGVGRPGQPPVDHRPRAAYNTEAVLWGAFIEQRLDELSSAGKVTIAALVMNNDFGKAYDGGASRRSWPSSPVQGPHRVRHRDHRAAGADHHRRR
jgi:branched-chain amino acid transport system substrate-binding protein